MSRCAFGSCLLVASVLPSLIPGGIRFLPRLAEEESRNKEPARPEDQASLASPITRRAPPRSLLAVRAVRVACGRRLLAPWVARYSLARVLHGRLRRKRKEHHLGGLGVARVSRESCTRAKCLRCTDELLADRSEEASPMVRYAAGSVCGLEIRRRARNAVRVHVSVPAVSGVVQSADLAEIAVRIVAEGAVVAQEVVVYLVAEVVEVASGTNRSEEAQKERIGHLRHHTARAVRDGRGRVAEVDVRHKQERPRAVVLHAVPCNGVILPT